MLLNRDPETRIESFIKLERAPEPSEEKLALSKLNNCNNPGSNFDKARELLGRLDRAIKNVGYIRLE